MYHTVGHSEFELNFFSIDLKDIRINHRKFTFEIRYFCADKIKRASNEHIDLSLRAFSCNDLLEK